MKFLITADWQAKFANLDACRRAHEQELNIIERHNIKGHIDLGDLKDDFNPVDVDVVQFQQERKERIHDAVVYDITLLGNHDCLGQNTAGRNWFSLFDSISGYNIKTPQILELGDCTFSCLPFRRSNSLLVQQANALYQRQLKLNRAGKHILLFHCDVATARYNNINSRRSGAKITTENLHSKYYDMCFGGHIHLYQHLNKNSMYVGNPFCSDAGEIDQQKGFVIYDSETNETRRILSKVPGLFSWNYVKKHKPHLIEGTKIKAIVDCEADKDYHKLLDKTATAIEAKYPGCIPYVLPQFETNEISKEYVVVDPDSTDYDKIKAYVHATVPANLRHKQKALIQYVASVLGNATSSGIRQSGKIIFDSVEAQNVLSFRKLKFNFRNRGLVLIRGDNQDSPWNSNGAGKSNLLSMIPVACFGRTFKDQKNDQWASDLNSDKAKLELVIQDEAKRKLVILRGRRPVKLKFEINGIDESKGRRHVGKKETQGLIEETIGYTFETLANSVYLDQSLQNAFLIGTNKERAELIHKFQNFDRFKFARDIVSKEFSLLSKNRQALETEEEVAETLIKQVAEDIALDKKRSKDNIRLLVTKKKVAKVHLRILKLSLHKLLFVYSSKDKKIKPELKKLSIALATVQKEILTLEVQHETKENELEDIKKLSGIKKCPVCSQDLTSEHKRILVVRFKKAIGAKKTELKKKGALALNLGTRIDLLQKPLDSFQQEIDNVKRLIERAEARVEETSLVLARAKAFLEKEQSAKSVLVSRKNKLQTHISRIKRVLQNAKDDGLFLQYAQEAMSRDGLPSFLNKLLVPLLNKASSYYSEIFIDKEIQVLFDVEEGHIVPKIINAHGGDSINAQSTGEKAWAGIICSFALREIAHPTNLLILDEPGAGLDVESAKMFGSRLSRLRRRFETILVVSHNPAIVSALDGDNSVTVVKKHKISSIE